MSENTAKLLYYTLIYPHLSNGLYLWGSICKTYLNKLSALQKKAVRCIPNAEYVRTHFATILETPYTAIRIYVTCEFCVGQFMYRQVKCVAPVSILPQITFNQNIHHYETWVSANVRVQYRRTHKVATSFINTAPHYWNTLQYELHNMGSITTFNKLHKRYTLCHAMA